MEHAVTRHRGAASRNVSVIPSLAAHNNPIIPSMHMHYIYALLGPRNGVKYRLSAAQAGLCVLQVNVAICWNHCVSRVRCYVYQNYLFLNN